MEHGTSHVQSGHLDVLNSVILLVSFVVTRCCALSFTNCLLCWRQGNFVQRFSAVKASSLRLADVAHQ